MSEILDLRNAANNAKDFRQPIHLQEQVIHEELYLRRRCCFLLDPALEPCRH